MPSSPDFPHLDRDTAAIAALPAAERRVLVARPVWVDYPAATALLHQLRLLTVPPPRKNWRSPPPAAWLLAGAANTGKTALVEQLIARAHQDCQVNDQRVTVVKARARGYGRPDEMIALAVLRALAPSYQGTCVPTILSDAVDMLRRFAVVLLVVDDCDSLDAEVVPTAVRTVRWLQSKAGCNALLAGRPSRMAETEAAFRKESFPIGGALKIPLLPPGSDDLRTFAAGLERTLPLRRQSGLGTPAIADTLARDCGGIVGAIIERVHMAASSALDVGQERISRRDLFRRPDRPARATAAQGPGTSRSSVAGRQPRAWPRMLTPQPDETVRSWADRVSTWFGRRTLGLALRDFAGLPRRSADQLSVLDSGLHEVWIRALIRVGFEEPTLRALGTNGYADRGLCCPACQATERFPYRRQRWQHPWAAACTSHRVLLVQATWLGWQQARPRADPPVLAMQHALDTALMGGDVDLGWALLGAQPFLDALSGVSTFLDRHDPEYPPRDWPRWQERPAEAATRAAALFSRLTTWPAFLAEVFGIRRPAELGDVFDGWKPLPKKSHVIVSKADLRRLPPVFRAPLSTLGLDKRASFMRRQYVAAVGVLLDLAPAQVKHLCERRRKVIAPFVLACMNYDSVDRDAVREAYDNVLRRPQRAPPAPAPRPPPAPPPSYAYAHPDALREPAAVRQRRALKRSMAWCRRHQVELQALDPAAYAAKLQAVLDGFRAGVDPEGKPLAAATGRVHLPGKPDIVIVTSRAELFAARSAPR